MDCVLKVNLRLWPIGKGEGEGGREGDRELRTCIVDFICNLHGDTCNTGYQNIIHAYISCTFNTCKMCS